VLITQYPEATSFPQALAMNCGTKWAMRVDNAQQSNAILGAGPSGGPGRLQVRPAAARARLAGQPVRRGDRPRPQLRPGRGRARRDHRAAGEGREDPREGGRLAGQWEDPIERHLLNATGLSSAAGGPKRDGIPGRNVLNHTPEQRMQMDALRGCLKAMNDLGRDVAQVKEMAEIIGGGMTETRLGKLLRDGGAGGTVKVDIEGGAA
jgi:S-DNA-T family DNA segregation ATPase FtsK/SpoIIIE